MPGVLPRTSTSAMLLYPYIFRLATKGVEAALAFGVNTYQGQIVYPAVAEVLS